jgi:hypothetical protein
MNGFKLSDEQLTDLATDAGEVSERLQFVAREAVHELRERRLRDLSEEEIEALVAIRERVVFSDTSPSKEPTNETQLEFRRIAERRRLGVAVLDRLIGSGQRTG